MFGTRRKTYRLRRRRIINPPFRYFLTPTETALALGISPYTLLRWRKLHTIGIAKGPEPVALSESVIRYRWDDVHRQPGLWLEKFLEKQREDLFPKLVVAATTAEPAVEVKKDAA